MYKYRAILLVGRHATERKIYTQWRGRYTRDGGKWPRLESVLLAADRKDGRHSTVWWWWQRRNKGVAAGDAALTKAPYICKHSLVAALTHPR